MGMLQTPVLIGPAFVLRAVTLPAELKDLALAVAAVVLSFWLARVPIERVPGMHRILQPQPAATRCQMFSSPLMSQPSCERSRSSRCRSVSTRPSFIV